jgi:methanogenic corrinoid protein MtbC1
MDEALHRAVAQEIGTRRSELAASARVARPQPGLPDVEQHLLYLAEAISAQDPSLFAEYAGWAAARWATHTGADDDGEGLFPRQLEALIAVLHKALPGDMVALVDEYTTPVSQALLGEPPQSSALIEAAGPLAGLATSYLAMLLRGERHIAGRLILDAVAGGVDVQDIYLRVFQPVQREVGALWQQGRIDLAQEHYCTAATQLIMSRLYPYVFGTERRGRRLLAACVGGELHEIGIRMVADFFQMAGWDTYYVGANIPVPDLLQAVVEQQPDVLALSVTLEGHVPWVAELIALLRRTEIGREMCVLVGGQPFSASPGLWREVGASGCADDAREAVRVAEALLAGVTP